MSRPTKLGIDYFPMDVNLDDKIELIEAKYQLIGFAIIVKLWQKIYREGYFLKWNEEIKLIFCKRNGIDILLLDQIIIDCLRWDLFNEKLYKEYSILTSTGIQKRFLSAITRRKEIEIIKEYWLLNEETAENVTLIELMYDNNSQSKVDKSKLNKIKEEEKKLLEIFNEARTIYPGIKRGNETEFNNFKKKYKDWKEILPILTDAINNQIKIKVNKKAKGEFVPEWKNFSTWINNRCWEEEITTIQPTKKKRFLTYLDIRNGLTQADIDKINKENGL